MGKLWIALCLVSSASAAFTCAIAQVEVVELRVAEITIDGIPVALDGGAAQRGPDGGSPAFVAADDNYSLEACEKSCVFGRLYDPENSFAFSGGFQVAP